MIEDWGAMLRGWVARLDGIPTADPERAHALADDILLEAVPEQVRAAYRELEARCRWWASG